MISAPRFTAEQRAAIEDRRGSALLAANAGSGKTAVMVERFVEAVLLDGVPVGAILALTFTEKAAGELRERVRRRLTDLGEDEHARAVDGAWIGTIHGFCARRAALAPARRRARPALRRCSTRPPPGGSPRPPTTARWRRGSAALGAPGGRPRRRLRGRACATSCSARTTTLRSRGARAAAGDPGRAARAVARGARGRARGRGRATSRAPATASA